MADNLTPGRVTPSQPEGSKYFHDLRWFLLKHGPEEGRRRMHLHYTGKALQRAELLKRP